MTSYGLSEMVLRSGGAHMTSHNNGGSRISLKGGTGKQFMIVCITKDWIKYSGIDP